jgi:hypothetical protein
VACMHEGRLSVTTAQLKGLHALVMLRDGLLYTWQDQVQWMVLQRAW